jgi:hypothetical protein
MTVDVNGHLLEVGDTVEVVNASAAQKVGLRAKVVAFRGPPGHVDMRWNEHSSGGANGWIVKGEYVRFVERPGHDCVLCAVAHVHGL